jgi:tetratricopeptide (TPR) repeat protein
MSNRYLEEAIAANRALGNRLGVADVMLNFGSSLLEMGQLARAHEQYLESAALYDELGIRHQGYTVLIALTAFASVHAGAYRRAREEAQQALMLSQQYGHKRSEGLALITLGLVTVALNDDAAAAAYLATGSTYLREIGQLEELAQGLGSEALLAFRRGQIERAKQFVLEALAIATGIQGLWSSPSYALAAWALMLVNEGEEEQARTIYQLALAEPFTASSRWFADMAGRSIPHSPPASFMPPDERWAAITLLYQAVC